MKEIYLGAGCFWGAQKYFKLINGVKETEVGYANGKSKNPTYEDVCNDSGHVECVKVIYDETRLDLKLLLNCFYEAIDVESINKQGEDQGIQYRSGIYYNDDQDLEVINKSIDKLKEKYKVAIEVKPLLEFYSAEEYHQNYLDKNINGYCHLKSYNFEYAKKVNR